MTVKRCPRCKTDNPEIYDHCLNCGTPLPEITKPQGMKRFLLPVFVVVFVVIVAAVVVVPALHYSLTSGRIISTAISSTPLSQDQIPQYELNQPARAGDLQVNITGDHLGEVQFNGDRFYTVIISVQNFNSEETYTLSASDFILTDNEGNYYNPLGIQSKTSYDALPNQTGTADLVYIIPQGTNNLRLLYTFPPDTAVSR